MLEKDSLRRDEEKLNGPNWKMMSHVKMKDNDCEEKQLEEHIVIPLKQMIREDEDEEYFLEENVIRLTGNVRACYLNHLEKILVRNYEVCCETENPEQPLCREDVINCAAWMEQKALRSCMVVLLYQRAMTRLTADIKKHTEQLKLYRKLRDYVTRESVWCDKTTNTESFERSDTATQTDPETFDDNSEIKSQETVMQSQNIQVNLLTQISTITQSCSLIVKEELPSPKIKQEITQGVPIPVHVSGMNSSINRSESSPYIVPNINGIEPIGCPEVDLEMLHNGNFNNLHTINTEIIHPNTNNVASVSSPTPKDSINEDEPYEWSVIEEQTNLKSKGSNDHRKPRIKMRSLSELQENTNSVNKILCQDELNNVDNPRMSIDERISSVFRRDSCHILNNDENQLSDLSPKTDKQPSAWSIEKCHQQELLHAKILETCVDVKKRGRMRLRFLELFGSDSEDSFNVDEHVVQYKDRIARWVVDSLMPYYRQGRIQSRPLFKFLARHIADTLLLNISTPDEADVEQSVMEFFMHHDIIQSEDDVYL